MQVSIRSGEGGTPGHHDDYCQDSCDRNGRDCREIILFASLKKVNILVFQESSDYPEEFILRDTFHTEDGSPTISLLLKGRHFLSISQKEKDSTTVDRIMENLKGMFSDYKHFLLSLCTKMTLIRCFEFDYVN